MLTTFSAVKIELDFFFQELRCTALNRQHIRAATPQAVAGVGAQAL
jgi:hypothetical protein